MILKNSKGLLEGELEPWTGTTAPGVRVTHCVKLNPEDIVYWQCSVLAAPRVQGEYR